MMAFSYNFFPPSRVDQLPPESQRTTLPRSSSACYLNFHFLLPQIMHFAVGRCRLFPTRTPVDPIHEGVTYLSPCRSCGGVIFSSFSFYPWGRIHRRHLHTLLSKCDLLFSKKFRFETKFKIKKKKILIVKLKINCTFDNRFIKLKKSVEWVTTMERWPQMHIKT